MNGRRRDILRPLVVGGAFGQRTARGRRTLQAVVAAVAQRLLAGGGGHFALGRRGGVFGARRGGGGVAAQGVVQAAVEEIVGEAAFAEAHFVFGRVGIDVDVFGRDVEVEDVHRVAAVVEHVLVGLADGMRDDFVADDAAVDVEVLALRLVGGAGWQSHPAVEVHVGGAGVNRQRLFEQIVAEDAGYARGKSFATVNAERFAVVVEADGDAVVA